LGIKKKTLALKGGLSAYLTDGARKLKHAFERDFQFAFRAN
jgi:hypothetical protein